MISYPNGPAQEKDRPGLGICFGWNGRLRWWLRIYLGGWLGTSDACGRSPRHRGSGRPPESAQKRGAFHREPLPHFTPDLTGRTRPGPTKATPATVAHRVRQRHRRKGETSYLPAWARAASWNVTPGPNQPPSPPSSPPRHPSREPYQPTDPGPTPTSEQKQCPRPGGRPAADRTNGDPVGQPNTRTHPSAGPLVDASSPRQPAHHAPIQTNRWHASRRCRRPIRSVMLAT